MLLNVVDNVSCEYIVAVVVLNFSFVDACVIKVGDADL